MISSQQIVQLIESINDTIIQAVYERDGKGIICNYTPVCVEFAGINEYLIKILDTVAITSEEEPETIEDLKNLIIKEISIILDQMSTGLNALKDEQV